MAWDTGLTGPHLTIAQDPRTPLRVMAGPGTGKTFALMRRVARLLETGTSPSDILVVSFTRTAANDLITNLRSLGSPGAGQVRACTLHSFCFSLLSQNAVFQATNRVPRPLMPFETDSMVTDLAGHFGGKRIAAALLKAFGAYWATLQHHQPGWPQDPIQQNFHRDLMGWLIFHESMLIGELVPRALDYIRQNPASAQVPSYAHVLVDEYQDLNRADQELIDALARNGTLTVIGDEDQSIYTRLRHARPDGIVMFHQSHMYTHDVPLTDCKRCPRKVVHMGNSLILQNHPQRPSTIRALPGNCVGDVYIVQHNSLDDEVNCTAAFINWYLTQHPDDKPGDILVLSTRRLIGYAIRDELARFGHLSQSFFTEECLEKLSAREGYCLLTLLVRSNDRAALRAWLGLDNRWRSPAYQRIWQAAASAGSSVKDVMDRIVSGAIQPPPHTADLMQRYVDLSLRLQTLNGVIGQTLIDALWPPGDTDCEDIRGIALAVGNTAPSLSDLLDDINTSITQPELPTGRENIIRVMSLHKSKGLTAKCVIVVGCVAGALPTLDSGLSQAEKAQSIEEQRRLFYVAITRTTHTLVLSSAASVTYGFARQTGFTVTRVVQGNAVLQASPFMSELGQLAPSALSGSQWRSKLGF